MAESFPNLIKVGVVCRANEVRSRIIEGYLRKRFPNFDIRSFGTEVNVKNKISSVLCREMSNWGIEISSSPPQSFLQDIDFLSNSNFIISADITVANSLGEKGIDSYDLCDFAIEGSHIPADPIDFFGDKYLVNAAKVLHCAARFASRVIVNSSGYESISAIEVSGDSAFDLNRSVDYVVDARLRHIHEFTPLNGEIRYFDESELFSGALHSNLSRETRVYRPRFEFQRPELALISEEWATFVKGIANFGAVSVITAHASTNNRQLWDPYLGSILAARVDSR
jgi:protein-tyrosine-phosphatase